MNNKVIELINNKLKWNINNSHSLVRLGGLNNVNYKITYNDKHYFIRESKKHKTNNSIELDIIKKASSINLCPSPLLFDIENGTMVNNWIYGSMPTEEQSNSIAFIKLLVNKIKLLHNLKCDNYFNPFNEIRNRLVTCANLNIPLPKYINKLIDTLDLLEKDLLSDITLGLCHNDLNPSNILINTNDLFIIDYEFASMGDVFFDLATIAWLIDIENHKILLTEYFSFFNELNYSKLLKYIFVVKMFNATWSLIKSLDNTSNYDYINGANIIFEDLISKIDIYNKKHLL